MPTQQKTSAIKELLGRLEADPTQFSQENQQLIKFRAREYGIDIPESLLIPAPLRKKSTIGAMEESYKRLQDEIAYGTFGKESLPNILEPLKEVLTTKELKGSEGEQINILLENIVKEGGQALYIPAEIAHGMATQPWKTAKGIRDFFYESNYNLLTASGINPETWPAVWGDEAASKKLYDARQHVAQHPVFTVLGAVGLAKGLKVGPAKVAKKQAARMAPGEAAFLPPKLVIKLGKYKLKTVEKPARVGGLPVVVEEVIRTPTITWQEALLEPKPPYFLKKPTKPTAKLTPGEQYSLTVRPGLRGKVPVALTQKDIKIETFLENQRRQLESKNKITPKKTYSFMRRKFWDVAGNAKAYLLKEGGQAGKEAVMNLELVAGATARAEKIYADFETRTFRGLNKAEEQLLADVLQSRRTIEIDIAKDLKGETRISQPGGFHAEDLAPLLRKWPDMSRESWSRVEAARAEFATEMKSQLDQLNAAGLLTKESYDALIEYRNYEPRLFMQHLDPEISIRTSGGRIINVNDSGIRPLSEGSEQALFNNPRLLASQVIARTQGRIARNEANKSLHQFALENPGNGMVEISPPARYTKAGKPEWDKVPGGHHPISVVIEGQKQRMLAKNEFAREWIVRAPEISPTVSTAARILSGSFILRPFATGMFGPEFAISNIPRDIALSWFTTNEYSNFMPYAYAQYAKDIKTVFKDAAQRKGRYLDYIKEGGGMEFMTHQGRVMGRAPRRALGALTPKFRAFRDYLEWSNNTSEILIRLALRERAIKGGKSPTEATWIARRYLDFSQGGSLTKAVDTAIPYLNAGVQATRSVLRAFKEDPAMASWKVGQMTAMSIGLYLANQAINPEGYDQVHPNIKEGNWVFMTDHFWIDEQNQKRYLHVTIPKDQGQRVFTSIGEMIAARALKKEVPTEQFYKSIKDFIPIARSWLPPSMSAYLGYIQNKDFWRNEEIWKYGDVEPTGEEYTAETHPFFINAGRLGLSPERTRYALGELFTRRNIYSDALGAGWKTMTGEVSEKEKADWGDKLRKTPFGRRLFRSTSPFLKEREIIEEIRVIRTTKVNKQNRQLRGLTDEDAPPIRVLSFIKEQPESDWYRLLTRYNKTLAREGIPYYLLNASTLSPEGRAVFVLEMLRTRNEEERRNLFGQIDQIPGFVTKDYLKETERILKGLKQKE